VDCFETEIDVGSPHKRPLKICIFGENWKVAYNFEITRVNQVFIALGLIFGSA
jgi:hypothetical protein